MEFEVDRDRRYIVFLETIFKSLEKRKGKCETRGIFKTAQTPDIFLDQFQFWKEFKKTEVLSVELQWKQT